MDYHRFLELAFDDQDEVLAVDWYLNQNNRIYWSSLLFRKHWDHEYLLNLAQQEGSFVAEYRVAPREFDISHALLKDGLRVNEDMERRAMGTGGSEPISTASRLGVGLILLGGGRRTQAMRTHDVSHEILAGSYSRLPDFPAPKTSLTSRWTGLQLLSLSNSPTIAIV